ncbi:MAG: topoisomerase [Thermoplasmata archaeon]|nr:MAG: topoisomerase [Thermoplasmata archaeon]RLF36876.1 MAG: topoisomerase [Thermoplasmata archaeon]
MDYKKSLEELEKAIEELREENKNTPILVEGERDIEALRKLDINGKIICINTGMPVSNLCDIISQKHREIILLIDWDRKGGHLCLLIRKNLQGRVKCNTRYREIFAKRSMIRTIEGLPSWINRMKEKTKNI